MATTTETSVGNENANSSAVSSASCGVAELADSESAADWGGTGPDNGLVFGGVSYQATGPLGSAAATFNGSTGWVETTKEYDNPESYTILMWLKTTVSGSILGFSSSQDPHSPSFADRQMWVDSSGKLVWGLYDGAADEVTTSSAVDTGNWVFVAGTLGTSGATLYVNGAQAGTDAAYTAADNYFGWWTLGWAYYGGGWADEPTYSYFDGSMAQVAIIPSQLTAGQVSTIYAEPTPSAYAAEINTFSPADYWPLTDTGSVPYPGPVPGTQTLADSSGNGDTGTASGGVTFGATGPTSLGTSSAVSLDGSTGYVETATSYSDPTGFSVVAWFKTTTTSGGTIVGFDSSQNNETASPNSSDRLLWMDNTGHLVWGIYDNATEEITSPSAYNTGAWFMVVAESGSSGTELYVDDVEVAEDTSYTTPQSYTGYWHIGWGDEVGWTDPPTSSYLNGSVSEVAIVPSLLTGTASGTQIYTLYHETTTTAYSTYMVARSPTAYWALQDSASNICGTTEITVQETVGSASTCVYPPEAVGTACPALSSAYLVTGLGTRSSSVVPISGTPMTVTVKMELSAASGDPVAGLHMLPAIVFAISRSTTPWSAQVSYPSASVEL